jgi:hypothetical protein
MTRLDQLISFFATLDPTVYFALGLLLFGIVAIVEAAEKHRVIVRIDED